MRGSAVEDRESQLKEVSKMNQIMTDYQRELAIEHLGLIDQVIRKRIRVRGTPLLSYEDFYSVGCEALCDAAMRYRPEEGEFEPYAYVMLYHAMIDHCRKQNRQQSFASDLSVDVDNEAISLEVLSTTDGDIEDALDWANLARVVSECKKDFSGVARLGIEALELKSLGYTSREIAERYSTTVNNVNAWISRARSKLMSDSRFLAAVT
jgi:RNA polymerase sigma factor (sigma-70 family)